MKLSIFGVDIVSYIKLEASESRVLPWVAADGDNKLRFNYDLNHNSVVYDVGGYKGEWAEPLFKLYGCYIEIFEPVKQFVKILDSKFKNNNRIRVYPFGLAGRTRKLKINVDLEASSIFKHDSTSEEIKLERATSQIRHDKIDLMKINIEGGEYELLEHLIHTGDVIKIKNIQVQFHTFVPDAIRKRQKLQKSLSNTHELTYNYRFIWENWRLKDV